MELFDKIKKGLFLMSLCFICLGQTVAQNVAKIGSAEYLTLQAAVDAAFTMDGDVTILLINNMEGNTMVKQKVGLNLIIDGQNHDLTGQILILGQGHTSGDNLTIQNINFKCSDTYITTSSSSVDNAFICAPNCKESGKAWYTNALNDSHDVTISNCTFDGTGCTNNMSIAAVRVPSKSSAFRYRLENLTVSNIHSVAQIQGMTDMTITGCTATSGVKNGINISGGSGTFDIIDNEITTLTGSDQYGIRIQQDATGTKTANLSGNTITAPNAVFLNNTTPTATTINITSGTYNGEISVSANDVDITSISGGTYSDPDIAPELAYGYTLEDNGNGTYSVVKLVVAKIGDDTYPSLQDAVDTAYAKLTGDVTINLVKDITGEATINQKVGLNYTIDGNNHTLNGRIFVDGKRLYPSNDPGEVIITNMNFTFNDALSYGDATKGFVCNSTNNNSYAAHVTVSHCTFDGGGASNEMAAFRAPSGASIWDVTLDNLVVVNCHSLAQLTGTTGATITNDTVTYSENFVNISGGTGDFDISNCYFNGTGYAARLVGTSSAEANLSNNNFISSGKVLMLGKNNKYNPSGHINVVSGTYNGQISKETVAGSTAAFVFTGGTFDQPVATVDGWCAPGYQAFDNGDATCTVEKARYLIYVANGGTGTMDTVAVRLSAPTAVVVVCNFTFGTMDFLSWNTVDDGSGTSYDPDDVITLSTDTTRLYAQWDAVAKIGAKSYPSLQDAIDDANANMTGDVTINLMKNTSEVVTVLQKAENNLTINGNGNTLTGQMFISANGNNWDGTDWITIQNLKFKYDVNYFEGTGDEIGLLMFCKHCYYISGVNCYAHNITIENCDFDADGSNKGVYGVAVVNSVKNITVDHCTAQNAMGLALMQSGTPFAVTNCKANDVTYGLRLRNNTGPHTIANDTIVAEEIGIYVDYYTTNTALNLSDNKFEAPIAFKLDNTCTGGTFNITGGTYIGTFEDNATSDFFNITGGTYSEDVTGEPCAPGYAAFANGTNPETWTVTKAWFLYYDKNEAGASGTMDTLFVRRDGIAAERTLEVAPCEFTWLPNHSFKQWNTKADGNGTPFVVGDNIELNSDTTLYVIWQEGNTIFYHNNGGTGTIANQYKAVDETITLSDGTGFTKTDSTLYRWNTTADEAAGSTDYALGASYSDNANLNLYAVWRLNLDMTSTATDVVCYGQNNGTDTVKIVGGEAPYKLVLSGGALETNQEVTTTENQYIFTGLKPSTTDYTVSLTDVLNATPITKTFTISEPQELLITSLTVPEKPCPLMGTGEYAVSMTTTGGNGGNTITWEGDAEDVNDLSTTVNSETDDRDKTYTVSVKVTDSKGCEATQTATFSVAPVIANDETTHSNTTMTIAAINKVILDGCDTIIRDFGTPVFAFTNAAITEDILDTVYNNVSTVAPDSVFAAGTTTVITWTAVDTCGHEVTATQEITIAYAPCPSVEDFDHNVYPAVRIGCDCWTTKNLSSTHYSDGREIENVMHYPVNTRATVGGNLYDWYATVDTFTNSVSDIEAAYAAGESIQGICPEGWHVPTEAELNELMGQANPEDLMSLDVWIPNVGTNATGFDMYPAGCYNSSLDRYERMYVSAYFWILTPPTSVYHACEFGSACSTTELIPGSLTMGYSVRCVLDKSDE